jgi:ABC-2 type transport system permease protein
MYRTFILTLHELRQRLSDPSILINLVVVPLLITFAIGSANLGGGDEQLPLVDIIDNDQSSQSQALVALLSQSDTLQFCAQASDSCELQQAATQEQVLQRLESGKILAIIEIPQGFANNQDRLISFHTQQSGFAPNLVEQNLQNALVRYQALDSARNAGERLVDQIGDLSDEQRQELMQQIDQRSQALWQSEPIVIRTSYPEQSEQVIASGFAQSVPGISSMYVLFAVLPLGATLLRDRQQWTLQRLISMPLRPAQVLSGKLFCYFLLGMVQFAVIFGFGALMGMPFGSSPLALLATMLSYSLAVTGLALMLSNWVKTPSQANSINLLITLVCAPLGGAWWPLEIVPEWMRTVGHISPIAWAMDAFSAVLVRGAGLGDIWLPLAALLAMALAFFSVGVARLNIE